MTTTIWGNVKKAISGVKQKHVESLYYKLSDRANLKGIVNNIQLTLHIIATTGTVTYQKKNQGSRLHPIAIVTTYCDVCQKKDILRTFYHSEGIVYRLSRKKTTMQTLYHSDGVL